MIGNELNFTQEDVWAHKFDYVFQGNPPHLINPPQQGMNALNVLTGELFFCVDNTKDKNVWKGQLGTISGYVPLYERVDIFGDESTVAFYPLLIDGLDKTGEYQSVINGTEPTYDDSAIFNNIGSISTGIKMADVDKSVSLWVSVSVYNAVMAIYGHAFGSQDRFYIRYYGRDIRVDAGAFGVATTVAEVPIDTWMHVVAMCDFAADSVTLHCNGEIVTGTGAVLSEESNGADHYIGHVNSLVTDGHIGALKGLRVFNKVLSESEISILAAEY